jgi:hypothetical protein
MSMPVYAMIAPENHSGWSPFDPHALGALIEAYTWITQPQRMTSPADRSRPGTAEYSTARYNDLTEMLRRAIAKERTRVGQTAVEPLQLVMPFIEAA